MPARPRSAAPDGNARPAPPSIAESLLFAIHHWPIDVDIGNHTYTIPAMPACDWIPILLSDDPGMDLLDLIDPDDTVMAAMICGEIDAVAVTETFLEVITLASGRPWWVTLRLLYAAQGAWDTIGGALTLKGVHAASLPLQAWMDALLATVMAHTDPKDQTSMLAKLKAPPPGQAPIINEAAEEAAFMQALRGQ